MYLKNNSSYYIYVKIKENTTYLFLTKSILLVFSVSVVKHYVCLGLLYIEALPFPWVYYLNYL